MAIPFPTSDTYSDVVNKYCNKAIWGAWLVKQTNTLETLKVIKELIKIKVVYMLYILEGSHGRRRESSDYWRRPV